MTFAVTAAAVAAVGSLAGAAPAVTFTAPGHAPKIKTHWNYQVVVTSGGQPAAATLTEQIVDPIGGVHPVQFGKSTKNITNWKFKGTFSDFIIWPASSRGIPLTLRITVKTPTGTKVVKYVVTAR